MASWMTGSLRREVLAWRRCWSWKRSRRCWNLFFQAEDGIRDLTVTGVQTCALPISRFCGVTTTHIRYAIDGGLGLTSDRLNQRVRRKTADPEYRGDKTPYEEVAPFDGDRKSVV